MSNASPLLFTVDALSPETYAAGADLDSLVKKLVDQALDIVVATPEWPKGKVFNAKHRVADGGPVQTRSKKSGMGGRAGKCSWHMRESVHPTEGTGLTYDDFRSGLLLDHAAHEMEYIPGLVGTKTLEVLKAGSTSVILNSYKLPMVTADRDFLELLITVDLPAHAAPLSPAHRAAIAELTELGINPSPPSTAAEAGGLRSFLVVQVPVTHPDAPEQKNYVRGAYASVEAVYEASGPTGLETHWKMATQSDAKGSIPLFLSESSLPGKISEDVPEFVHWAQGRHIKSDTSATPAAPAAA
ncbi:hypothetical protein OC835_003486 [Tilletia horrida]|nr:hypothetical protein OC835_003486 [Tilletia horrida]